MQTMTRSNSIAGDTHTRSGFSSTGAVWAGRVLTTFAVLFLVFDSVGKLLAIPPVVAGAAELGYPPGSMFGIGLILLACVVVYVIPRTSVLGAVLLTGYLGGAVATHVRVGNPLFSHALFPIYVALFAWGGLFLRDAGLRELLPWRARRGRVGDPVND